MAEYIEKAELIKKLCYETAEWFNSPTIQTIAAFPSVDIQHIDTSDLIEFCEEIAKEYEERAEKYDRWDEEESVYADYCTSYAAKHRKIAEILKEVGW